MFTLIVFAGVFELDGDECELEVGEEGSVEPVVAGGGLAVVLHAVEDAFHDVPPLVRSPMTPRGFSWAARPASGHIKMCCHEAGL